MKPGDLVKIIWTYDEPEMAVFVKYDEHRRGKGWVFWDNCECMFDIKNLEIISESR